MSDTRGRGVTPADQAALWNAVGAERAASAVIDVLIPLLEVMLDLTRVGRGTRYLDVGCGSGESCRMAVARGAQVTGSDVSPTMIATARERVAGARFDVADMAATPYEDGCF